MCRIKEVLSDLWEFFLIPWIIIGSFYIMPTILYLLDLTILGNIFFYIPMGFSVFIAVYALIKFIISFVSDDVNLRWRCVAIWSHFLPPAAIGALVIHLAQQV